MWEIRGSTTRGITDTKALVVALTCHIVLLKRELGWEWGRRGCGKARPRHLTCLSAQTCCSPRGICMIGSHADMHTPHLAIVMRFRWSRSRAEAGFSLHVEIKVFAGLPRDP
jgi:hypothetical protein